MNPLEKLQRLLKVQAAFPRETETLIGELIGGLPLTAQQHQRAVRGLTSESRFADVFSALDWTAMIHGLDQWQLPTDSKSEWQVPDYLIFVRTPEREPSGVLTEAKLVTGEKVTFEISLTQLDLLRRYADVLQVPLLIAMFWEKLHLWTIHTPDQLTVTNRMARLKFEEAVRNDVSVIFSDTLLIITTQWRRRTTYDPSAEGFHLRDPERGFVVEDHLAVDGSKYVELSEVESGIISKIMHLKILEVRKDGERSTVTYASTRDAVAKASSIVHLLLEQFEAFSEESEPMRALNTLKRLKSIAGIRIQPLLPSIPTPEVRVLFERTFGFSWSDDSSS